MEIKRCYDTLIGASVAENQLVQKRTNPTVTDGDKSIVVDDGKVIITVNGSSGIPLASVDWIVLQKNHKYLILANVPFSIGYQIYFTGYALTNINYGYIINYTGDTGQNTLRCYVGSSIAVGTYEVYPQCVDLTALLGSSIADYIYQLESATAGSGIAKLREWGFLRGYQAYNAGSIESVEVTGKKVVGFNQWDEEWELGTYINATGAKYPYATKIRNVNPIRVLPNTQYYYHVGSTSADEDRIWFYDADMTFISSVSFNHQTSINQQFTTPSNCSFINFSINNTTYNHDICINLSNPDRNGEYEPYKSTSYDLGSDVLRGLFKLDANNKLYADGDRKEADGTITRYYGTRTYQEGDESLADAITDGTTTVYKLSTPTTEISTPFTSPQVCYPDGTEEFVTENGVPVGHESKYQL